MKTLKYYLAFTAVFALLLTSCSKDETQMVDNPVSDEVAVLTFGPVLNDMLNRAQVRQDAPACSENAPAYAQISLTYGSSNTPVDVVVEILSDDDGLFTAYDEALEIPIPSGETSVAVTLTDFLVWDDDNGSPGSVIWAAPKEGSEYAQFVEDPLDMIWDLRAGTKKYVDVEVICFDDREVNLYGYQFFDIIPEVLYELCFFANYCSDSGRHYTANYNLNVWYGDPDNGGTLIYEGLMPATGNTEDDDSGDWYADPLCIAVPGPQDGEGADTPYLYYELTLADWPGSYGTAGDHMMSGSLSWNEVDMLLGDDGTSVEYEHVFINCGDDDGGECDANDPNADCDMDGVPNEIDECPDTMLGTPVQENGCDLPSGECDPNDPEDDCDRDGVPNGIDECPDTDEGVAVDEKGCESIQVPGRDVVVFNDINIFDNNSMADADNVKLVQNLVNFTTTGQRNNGDVVLIDRGRNARCYSNGECNDNGWATMRSVITNEGFSIQDLFSTGGDLTNIASDIKTIFLVMPTISYTAAEINELKSFAAEGGRIIFIGEHEQFYFYINVENEFLLSMGAVLTNTGGYIDCGYTTLPSASNREHPIMDGINQLTIACASVIEPGPDDFPLFYDTTNTKVLAGVAKIDTNPVSDVNVQNTLMMDSRVYNPEVTASSVPE
ncbi:hypothetical protein [Salegentibacter chungangensis]|uniref:Uncharacterized protein n=1 Tax=Salegentibacter chungangensis TaxID=1335724 RepID=A0ABW3NUE1_9FLAO